jgi:hypothetical protein
MRRIGTTLGAGLLALAVTAPCAGAVTLVSPANGAVITTKTTTLTWALDPATGEQTTAAMNASYPELFVPGGGFDIRRTDRTVWYDLHPFLEPAQTSVTTKPLFAGMNHWGALAQIAPPEGVGSYTPVPSAVGTFTVKGKVLGRGLKVDVSRSGSGVSLDWQYLTNLPRYTVTWTVYRNGQRMRGDSTNYRSTERSIYQWLKGDEFVGGRRGLFGDGDKVKLTVKITSRTDGVKLTKTFTKQITVS